MTVLKALRCAGDTKAAASRLYEAVTAQSRNPAFFMRLGVADTMDGRFDLVCLHAWLVLDRLEKHRDLAQAFVNALFVGFDDALRQSGTGDIGMNRRLKTLAGAFYGRLEAYRAATTEAQLVDAIQRNLFRGVEDKRTDAGALATYAMETRSCLADIDIANGDVVFAPLPPI